MTGKKLKLLLPSKPESLERIRKELENFIVGTPYEEKSFDILLAVSEAGTNVVRHAYGESKSKQLIILESIIRPDYLTVMVCDKGKGLHHSKKSVVFTEEGGFGLYLMKELTDKFKCHTSRLGTIVELGFKNVQHDIPDSAESEYYAFRWPSSIWGNVLNMFVHPKKNLVLYSDIVSSSTLTVASHAKSYARLRILSLLVRSRVKDLKKILDKEDFEVAKMVITDINRYIKNAEPDFNNIKPRKKQSLRKNFSSTINVLTELERILISSERDNAVESGDIYELIRKREILELLSETSNEIHKGLDDVTGCWLALDEGPLQLI